MSMCEENFMKHLKRKIIAGIVIFLIGAVLLLIRPGKKSEAK